MYVRGLDHSWSLNGLNGWGLSVAQVVMDVSVDCVLRCFN